MLYGQKDININYHPFSINIADICHIDIPDGIHYSMYKSNLTEMKKLTIVITLLFAVLVCAAPELDFNLKRYQEETALKDIKRRAYEKEFTRLIDHLRSKESPSSTAINQIGCMGWFQFTPATLQRLGYGHITPEKFRQDPSIFPEEVQVIALKALMACNENSLRSYMCYVGKTINGVKITKSGLLAGAHLGGAGGVITFLLSDGRVNYGDMNGTSIGDYIREFQGYNI